MTKYEKAALLEQVQKLPDEELEAVAEITKYAPYHKFRYHFSFIAVDDLMNAITSSQERATATFETIVREYQIAEWTESLGSQFRAEYHRFSSLLDAVTMFLCETRELCERWQKISANYSAQREKMREQCDDGGKTPKQTILWYLDMLNEDNADDHAKLYSIEKSVERAFSGRLDFPPPIEND